MNNLNLVPKTNFEIWRDSDNVVKVGEDAYKTQCSQYCKSFSEQELKKYFIKEYGENNIDYADSYDVFYLEFEVYVKFLDSKNKFKETTKSFKTFDEAWDWIVETFDNPSKDFIHYY